MPLIKSQTQHLKPQDPAKAENSIKLKVSNFSNGKYSSAGYMASRCESSCFAKMLLSADTSHIFGDQRTINGPERTETCQICFNETVLNKMTKFYLPNGTTTGWVCKSCKPSPNGTGYGANA